MWAHGTLYAAVAPAVLHAVSGGLMDPVFFTTVVPALGDDSVCHRKFANRTACAYEVAQASVDLKNQLPSVSLSASYGLLLSIRIICRMGTLYLPRRDP